MTDIIKVLGQVDATGASVDTLYTVPSLTQTTTSTLTICNRTATSKTIRVNVSVNGAPTSPSDEEYLFYNSPIGANTTVTVTIGMTLGPADSVGVYSNATGVSFMLFGVETS